MDLAQNIQNIFSGDDPSNESNTCDWIIRPTLLAIGYDQRDIHSRVADEAGKFPDYTILPKDNARKFYLEAKSWKIELQDNDAVQSLNYANHNGKRWVVLTNGKFWRLYDNRIEGTAAEKLVAEVNIENLPMALQFLQAIGKESMVSGKIEAFAASQREVGKLAAKETIVIKPSEHIAPHKPKRETQGYKLFIQLLENPISRDDLIAGMVKGGYSPSTATSYIYWSKRIVDESEMNPFGFQTEDFKNEQNIKFLRRRK